MSSTCSTLYECNGKRQSTHTCESGARRESRPKTPRASARNPLLGCALRQREAAVAMLRSQRTPPAAQPLASATTLQATSSQRPAMPTIARATGGRAGPLGSLHSSHEEQKSTRQSCHRGAEARHKSRSNAEQALCRARPSLGDIRRNNDGTTRNCVRRISSCRRGAGAGRHTEATSHGIVAAGLLGTAQVSTMRPESVALPTPQLLQQLLESLLVVRRLNPRNPSCGDVSDVEQPSACAPTLVSPEF